MNQENQKPRVKLHDKTFELSIPYAELDKAITALGDKINEDYKDVDTPLFLGVLSGAFMFMSELMQKINFPCELSFVKLSSYSGMASTGKVQELIGLRNNIEGRHVIIVEDIVDTGHTIVALKQILADAGAKESYICTLLLKPEAYKQDVKIDYTAIEIPNKFIVGFGLDYDELGRNYKDIYVLDE